MESLWLLVLIAVCSVSGQPPPQSGDFYNSDSFGRSTGGGQEFSFNRRPHISGGGPYGLLSRVRGIGGGGIYPPQAGVPPPIPQAQPGPAQPGLAPPIGVVNPQVGGALPAIGGVPYPQGIGAALPLGEVVPGTGPIAYPPPGSAYQQGGLPLRNRRPPVRGYGLYAVPVLAKPQPRPEDYDDY